MARHGSHAATTRFRSAAIIPGWTRCPLASRTGSASFRTINQSHAHACEPWPAHRQDGRAGRDALRGQIHRRCGGRRACRSRVRRSGNGLARRSGPAPQAHWAEYKRQYTEEGCGPDSQLQGHHEGAPSATRRSGIPCSRKRSTSFWRATASPAMQSCVTTSTRRLASSAWRRRLGPRPRA